MRAVGNEQFGARGMNIKSVVPMNGAKLITIDYRKSVADAVDLLGAKDIGLALIVDDRGELWGVVSERDIVKALHQDGTAVLDKPVTAIGHSQVVTCPGVAHPHDVLTMMYEHNIRHMPVLENGKVVGLVSSRDLIKYIAKQMKPDEQAMLWAKLIKLA